MKVKDLLPRYGLKTRQALHTRLKRLGLTLVKDDRGHNYATPEQLQQLDNLHAWLESGGSLNAYSPDASNVSVISVADAVEKITTIDTNAVEAVEILETTEPDAEELEAQDIPPQSAPLDEQSLLPLVSRLLNTLQPPVPKRSPLYVWEQLETACEKGWLLSTSQVKELTGVQPNGDVCEYGAFSFQRHGRIGREAGWEVWKNGY